MKRPTSKKMVTMIVILALLLLIPAGTLLADSLKNPKIHNETEETEPTEGTEALEIEEETEDGGNSAVVAERIVAAEALGIPPGHLNLIDKLAEISGKTREELLPLLTEGSVQKVMKEIKKYRFEQMGKEIPEDPQNVPEETGNDEGSHGKGLAKGHNKE
jgi:hypothetical protein